MKVTVPAGELQAALENGVTFSSKEAARPILQALELKASEDGVTVVATDSYILMRHRLEGVEVHDGGVVLIDRADATNIVRAIKALPRNGTQWPVVLTVEGRHVTVKLFTSTFEFVATDGTFPNYLVLIAGAESDCGGETPTGRYVLGTDRFAQLAKVKDAGSFAKNSAVALTMPSTPLKPALWRVGSRIDGLIMPIRVG